MNEECEIISEGTGNRLKRKADDVYVLIVSMVVLLYPALFLAQSPLPSESGAYLSSPKI